MQLDQKQKVLALMISRRDKQEWFKAVDFQTRDLPEELFVGYEATARMSDVMREYPQMIEAKYEGKYRYIRFKFENMHEIFETGTPDMVQFLDTMFMKFGVSKQPKVKEPKGLF